MSVPRETLFVKSFFDLKDVWFVNLFAGIAYPWEILIPKAIDKWIQNNIKPNLTGLKRTKSGLVLEDFELSDSSIKIAAGAIVKGEKIQLHAGVELEPTAFVQEPTILGPNTIIRHGAYVRGGVITGNSAIIGHASEVKNSIMLNSAKAAHFAYVGDSILGNHVNLGAGTKLSNLRIDQKEIKVRYDKQKISTGLRKFGAILGDDCETGCNSVLNPGVLLGRKSMVYPCASILGSHYPDGSVLK